MPQTAENDIHPVVHFHVGRDEQGIGYFTMEELAEIPHRAGHVIEYAGWRQ